MPRDPMWRRYDRLSGPDIPADVDEELEFHVQTLAERIAREEGVAAEEARRRAEAAFGDRARAAAACRDIGERRRRRLGLVAALGGLRRDVRHALRRLGRAPGFALVAVLTLALGIGANTAIFSVVHGVLLRPLPFADAGRLAMVWNDNSAFTTRTDVTSWPTFQDWRARSQAFHSMAGFTGGQVNLTGEFEATRLPRGQVEPGFFDVLGVEPVVGRTFTAGEGVPGQHRVVILGHRFWTERFGADRGVLGRSLVLAGQDYQVVGVMPAGMDFPNGAELWTPLALPEELRAARGALFLRVVGRLSGGADMASAQREMSDVSAALAQEYPDQARFGVYVQPLRDHLVGDVRPMLLLLLGAVALVLLIACANVANLFLSRAAARDREMAVRTALGAGRARLVAQLLTESVVVALLGGAAGLTLAYGGVALFRTAAPADLPRVDQVAVDPTVLLFTVVVSVVTGLLFGMAPALQALRRDTTMPLREGGRGGVGRRTGRRLRDGLVVAELALSVILLVGAGLLARSFAELSSQDTGFGSQGVLTARVALAGPTYQEPTAGLAFWEGLVARVGALPGVEAVGAGSDVFLAALPNSGPIAVEGQPARAELAGVELTYDAATPGFFAAVGTPFLAGRDFTVADRQGAEDVAIINRSAAELWWPGQDPVGRRFKFGSPESQAPWNRVVGVVEDARRTAQNTGARPSSWFPLRQFPQANMMLVVKSLGIPSHWRGPCAPPCASWTRPNPWPAWPHWRGCYGSGWLVSGSPPAWRRSSDCWRWRWPWWVCTASSPTTCRRARGRSACAWRWGPGWPPSS